MEHPDWSIFSVTESPYSVVPHATVTNPSLLLVIFLAKQYTMGKRMKYEHSDDMCRKTTNSLVIHAEIAGHLVDWGDASVLHS